MISDAQSANLHGTAVVGCLPDADGLSWLTQSRMTGSLVRPATSDKAAANFYGIAHAKAGVMMATLKDSGDPAHVPAIGEVGYRGGAIRRHGAGYLLAAFSGGTSDEDYAISERALSALEKLI